MRSRRNSAERRYPATSGAGGPGVWAGGVRRRARPADRLLRVPAGRPLHPPRERAGDGARVEARPGVLRGSGLLRQARARAGAGHRPHRHDPCDRRGDAADDRRGDAVGEHPVLLALAAVVADRRRGAGVSRREPLRVPRLCAEHPADAGTPADGLPAGARRQQGIGQGAEAFRPERFHQRPVPPARRIRSTTRTCAGAAPAVGGVAAFAADQHRATTGPTPTSSTAP